MADVLNKLGQDIIPSVMSKLQGVGLTETMTIKRETATVGTGGGKIKGSTTDVYTAVPVVVEPTSSDARFIQADQPRSVQEYKLTFATHDTAATPNRIAVDIATDRFYVNARGNEPAKVYRAITIPEQQGVNYEAVCVREDSE